jgi:hypothetical protein
MYWMKNRTYDIIVCDASPSPYNNSAEDEDVRDDAAGDEFWKGHHNKHYCNKEDIILLMTTDLFCHED